MLKLTSSFFVLISLILNCECGNRITVYPSIGTSVRLQCITSGQFVCFSTYTFKNASYAMVTLTNSLKYQVDMSGVTVNNVEATDAGYYGCSSNCNQMSSDVIDYYLHPTSNQLPIDVGAIFLPIPPYIGPENGGTYADSESFLPPVAPAYYGPNGSLNAGEIAGIVIGSVVFLIIVVAVIVFLVCCRARPNKKNQKKLPSVVNEPNSVVDYSTIERDYGLKGDTFRSDKSLILPDQRNLQDVDINSQPQRGGLDNQTRRNYEIADKIANQFSYENQQQNPQQAQSKQINARFDNQNSTFNTGLDGSKGQNLYSSGNGTPMRPSLPGTGPIAGNIQSNRGESEQPKTPTRNRIEFPKQGQQLPQVLPQLVRGPGANRQYSEKNQDDLEQTPPLLDHYDGTDEERRQLAGPQDSPEAQQPQSFKSLVKAQKASRSNINEENTTPTSRSYQGSAQQLFQQQQQQQQQQFQQPQQQPMYQQQQTKFQLPQQLPSRQPPLPAMYDKRSESMDAGAPVKDNATDV